MKRLAGTTRLAYARCESCTFLKNGFFAPSSAAILSQVFRNSIRMSGGVRRMRTPCFSCSSLIASAFCRCHFAHHTRKVSFADAIKELQEKHGVRILRTPPDILIEFLKTWDVIAAEEGQKNPFFKKVHDSQRAYASLVVPAKRFMFPPYSFVANYYWPEAQPGATKVGAKK